MMMKDSTKKKLIAIKLEQFDYKKSIRKLTYDSLSESNRFVVPLP